MSEQVKDNPESKKQEISMDNVPWDKMSMGEKTLSVLTHPVTVTVATFAAIGALVGLSSKTKASDIDLHFKADLSHDEIGFARQMYQERINRSWIHKNPVLSGALTFGLAHVFGESQSDIIQDVVLETRRNFPDLVGREKAEREAIHQRFLEAMPYHVQDRASSGQEAIASTMSRAAVASISAISRNNRAS